MEREKERCLNKADQGGYSLLGLRAYPARSTVGSGPSRVCGLPDWFSSVPYMLRHLGAFVTNASEPSPHFFPGEALPFTHLFPVTSCHVLRSWRSDWLTRGGGFYLELLPSAKIYSTYKISSACRPVVVVRKGGRACAKGHRFVTD